MRLGTFIPLILALATAPAGAVMFKWIDANGNTQYGQYPPAGVQAERIKTAPKPASAPSAQKSPQQQLKELEEQNKKAGEKAAEAEAGKQHAEMKKKNCEIARQNLEQLNLGGHRLTRMPDGSYQRFTEEEKQAMIQKNKEAVKEFCD